MIRRNPGRLPGADQGQERPSIADALRRMGLGRRGPALEQDAPAVSRFGMTPAARAARRHDRAGDHPRLLDEP